MWEGELKLAVIHFVGNLPTSNLKRGESIRPRPRYEGDVGGGEVENQLV